MRDAMKKAAVTAVVLAMSLGAGAPAKAAEVKVGTLLHDVHKDFRDGFVTGFLSGFGAGFDCRPAEMSGGILLAKLQADVLEGKIKPTDGMTEALARILFKSGCTKP
jgi:hypothetical protein